MHLVQYAKDAYVNIENIIDMSISGLDIIFNVQGYDYDQFFTVKPEYAENFLFQLEKVDKSNAQYFYVYKQKLQQSNL